MARRQGTKSRAGKKASTTMSRSKARRAGAARAKKRITQRSTKTQTRRVASAKKRANQTALETPFISPSTLI